MTLQEQLNAVIERLIEARKNAGLSQTQAAKLVGLATASSLSNYEARDSILNLELFLRLCEVYDISPVWALIGVNPNFDPAAWYEQMKTASDDVNEDLKKVAQLIQTFPFKKDGDA